MRGIVPGWLKLDPTRIRIRLLLCWLAGLGATEMRSERALPLPPTPLSLSLTRFVLLYQIPNHHCHLHRNDISFYGSTRHRHRQDQRVHCNCAVLWNFNWISLRRNYYYYALIWLVDIVVHSLIRRVAMSRQTDSAEWREIYLDGLSMAALKWWTELWDGDAEPAAGKSIPLHYQFIRRCSAHTKPCHAI